MYIYIERERERKKCSEVELEGSGSFITVLENVSERNQGREQEHSRGMDRSKSVS